MLQTLQLLSRPSRLEGGQPIVLFEHAGKLRAVGKAAEEGNVGQAEIAALQHFVCFLQTA